MPAFSTQHLFQMLIFVLSKNEPILKKGRPNFYGTTFLYFK